MSEQSIRVELAQVFRKKWASDFSEDYEDFELADAILASPVIRRIQAEARDEGASNQFVYSAQKHIPPRLNPYREKGE